LLFFGWGMGDRVAGLPEGTFSGSIDFQNAFALGNADGFLRNVVVWTGRLKRKMLEVERPMCEGESDGGTMSNARRGSRFCAWLAFWMVAMAPAIGRAGTTPHSACEKVVMTGEVNAGREWRTPIGEGWVFRVVPIDGGKQASVTARWSGWDLVVDREQPAGFPDALLLATPPYNSINEREIGTTFGLRAQDAIGWNPRSFRFLTQPAGFHAAQILFLAMKGQGQGGAAADKEAMGKLMELTRESAAGQFRILDARLTPGIADAAPFAENWALQATQTPHTFEPAAGGGSTPLGRFGWMKFSITLWLPSAWKAPAALGSRRAACSE